MLELEPCEHCLLFVDETLNYDSIMWCTFLSSNALIVSHSHLLPTHTELWLAYTRSYDSDDIISRKHWKWKGEEIENNQALPDYSANQSQMRIQRSY
ncbi:hypothetical protein O6P43_003788 [Quillaja saponaria]|uniref:Uncharacterized protein n=1 Tax=Quillaja saponaria TaxID=32244 RepID=A0AAD7QFH9_QUISA|nr:hypothetical protein O6P43_003788 [Quillaja saponaria]